MIAAIETGLTIALVLVALIVLAIGGIVVLAWWGQERIAFQPPGAAAIAEPLGREPGVHAVRYTAADGALLSGFLVVATSASVTTTELDPTPLVIAFHGNAELARWWIPWAKELSRRTGARVLLPEYRGYDGLAGTPSYRGSRLDAAAAWRFARESLHASPERTVLFGHSIGSAIATELAAGLAGTLRDHEDPALHPIYEPRHVRALVLQSPFTSARDMTRIIGSRPVQLVWNRISRIHFDTEARVEALPVPVFVTHGEADLLIPVRMGRRIHERAAVRRALLIVADAGHGDVPEQGGEEYWEWLVSSVER